MAANDELRERNQPDILESIDAIPDADSFALGITEGEMPDAVKEIARQNSEAIAEMLLTKKSAY